MITNIVLFWLGGVIARTSMNLDHEDTSPLHEVVGFSLVWPIAVLMQLFELVFRK